MDPPGMTLIMLTQQENAELEAMGLFKDNPYSPTQHEIVKLNKRQYKRMVQIAEAAAIRESLGQSRFLN